MSMPSAEGDAAAIVAAAETSSQAPVQKQQGGDDGDVLSLQQTAPKLAPFTPSGDGVLGFAMELLQLSAQDVLFDLGCGDARILVHAAQTSDARCVGVEYNAELVAKAKNRVLENGVEDRVTIVHGDALQVDLESATALFLYLVPQGIKMMLPKLEEARRKRVRIVTYVFSIPGWSYDDIRDFKGTKVYLYNAGSQTSSSDSV
ncbi:Protein-lysine N-methyltransferase [Globisporangium polare]